MLKKTNRINKTRELQRVYRSGKTMHTPALVIKFVPALKTRIAFVVSTKVSKKAVERNRIKRAVREQMRLSMKSLAVGDYMLVAKYGAGRYNNKELREQMLYTFKKSGVWQN